MVNEYPIHDETTPGAQQIAQRGLHVNWYPGVYFASVIAVALLVSGWAPAAIEFFYQI